MQTITLNVIKKNRVYFKCTNEKGYEVKLKVTAESENLEPGVHTVLVEDISVRSKYGVDVIYQLKCEVKKEDGIVTLKHRYNRNLVDSCRNVGGKFDAEQSVWVFPKMVEDAVEDLDFQYNSNICIVEITALDAIYGDAEPVYIMGYPLAKASGRDSGAKICEDVSLISGHAGSCGSRKNWTTVIEEGSVLRLLMSKQLIDKINLEKWEVKII